MEINQKILRSLASVIPQHGGLSKLFFLASGRVVGTDGRILAFAETDTANGTAFTIPWSILKMVLNLFPPIRVASVPPKQRELVVNVSNGGLTEDRMVHLGVDIGSFLHEINVKLEASERVTDAGVARHGAVLHHQNRQGSIRLRHLEAVVKAFLLAGYERDTNIAIHWRNAETAVFGFKPANARSQISVIVVSDSSGRF